MTERWQADQEQRDRADGLADSVSSAVFEALGSPVRGLLDEREGWALEDPDEVLTPDGKPLYDPAVWPVVVTDREGRRYQLEVDVHARELPPAAIELAQHAEEVATAKRLQAQAAQHLATFDRRAGSGLAR